VGLPDNWWGWLLMTLGMLGFWGLLIALVVALVRRPGAPDGQQHPGPEELLAERFARGEVDADQTISTPYRPRSSLHAGVGVEEVGAGVGDGELVEEPGAGSDRRLGEVGCRPCRCGARRRASGCWSGPHAQG
jgi:putative membrane protein